MEPGSALTYLDTHAAVWLAAGDVRRLSATARRLIDAGDLLLSPMASLEMEFLHERGRLTAPAQEITSSLHAEHGVRTCPHPFPAVVQASLPLTWTRDPFDRVIVGQALATGRALVTRDETIRSNFTGARW